MTKCKCIRTATSLTYHHYFNRVSKVFIKQKKYLSAIKTDVPSKNHNYKNQALQHCHQPLFELKKKSKNTRRNKNHNRLASTRNPTRRWLTQSVEFKKKKVQNGI